MNNELKESIDNLASADDKIRLAALQSILKITDDKVDWVYDVWNDLVDKLENKNSYQRSIAILVLCNLAKSDSENRIEECIHHLLAHTRDEKFITSRQCIQNIWKVAASNSYAREMILKQLGKQFAECAGEKHYNLIRLDIIQSIRLLYDYEQDDRLLAWAKEMSKTEKEEKYRKKYEAILQVN
jgi:CO dehydrogenase/acetyl-CoA synthase beta subunit